MGKFNFIQFSTASQPVTFEKPANLLLNGSNSFLDNVGNPHITGNVINLAASPEQFINLVATFYDNSSLGLVGTQSFGLNVANLSSNQTAPFDISITDNKTKTQAKFYSLNVDSSQSSMSFPLNPKFPLNTAINISEQFVNSTGPSNPLINGNQALTGVSTQNTNPVNDNDNNNNDGKDGDNNNNNGNGNDNQRGERKTDDNGNPFFNDRNCNERSGSSGGKLSECEEAEREEQSDQDDEDASDNSHGSSNNDNGANDENGNDDTGSDNGDDNNGDDNGDSDSDNNNNNNDENGDSENGDGDNNENNDED